MSACPFARFVSTSSSTTPAKCPVSHKVIAPVVGSGGSDGLGNASTQLDAGSVGGTSSSITSDETLAHDPPAETPTTSGKCPLGYDTETFAIGPLSCVICKALLHQSCRCKPCGHIFCRGCIRRFQDCPLCGADIIGLEPEDRMQGLVDTFIAGHARIKRQAEVQVSSSIGENSLKEVADRSKTAADVLATMDTGIYRDPSLERGSFLLQQAMRAFMAGNIESAKHRLQICLVDLRAELAEHESPPKSILCQLGAVLGSLGDCCRLAGDTEESSRHFESAVEALSNVHGNDTEVVHALAVSLNKLGDLRYYAQDFAAARDYYEQALGRRKAAVEALGASSTDSSSQILDMAISLAKVADADRAMGNVDAARKGFEAAADVAEGLAIADEASNLALVKRKAATVGFIRDQISDGTSA